MELMRNVALGQFVPGESLLHRLDPRSKIVILALFMLATFLLDWLPAYLVALGLLWMLTRVSALPLGFIVRSLRSVLFLALVTLIFNLFFTPGKSLFALGSLVATDRGLHFGLVMAGRLVLLVWGATILTLTTSPIRLTDGLESLLAPLRALGLPAHELAMMMTIALRFVPTLVGETDRIMKAQMARGAEFDQGGVLRRARGLIPILVPLFVRAFRHAEDLAVAMESRCYRGGKGRTRLRKLCFTGNDALALAVSAVLLTGLVWLGKIV